MFNNIEKKLKSNRRNILFFTSDWCLPCKKVYKELKICKEKYEDLKIININVDKNKILTKKLCIYELPTLLFFSYDILISKIIGCHPHNFILQEIEKL